MIKTALEKLANDIGFDMGLSDDVVQSDLINGFCRGLSNSMNNSQLDMQISYIVDKLDDKSHSLLKRIVSFIEEKETIK